MNTFMLERWELILEMIDTGGYTNDYYNWNSLNTRSIPSFIGIPLCCIQVSLGKMGAYPVCCRFLLDGVKKTNRETNQTKQKTKNNEYTKQTQ